MINEIMYNIFNKTKIRTLGSKVMMKEKRGTIRYSFIFLPGESVRYTFWHKYKILKPLYRYWHKYTWWTLRQVAEKEAQKYPKYRNAIFADINWRVK